MKQKTNANMQYSNLVLHYVTFLFFLQQCTTNFSKFSSFMLIHLFDCIFLNIENDPSTSQEVAGAYLSEEIWGKVSLY